jgi:hypothetical protein
MGMQQVRLSYGGAFLLLLVLSVVIFHAALFIFCNASMKRVRM